MERPKFTIVYNNQSEDGFVGVCWEFFTNEDKAQARYDYLASFPETYSPTIRPYYHDADRHHLGAGHWELKNTSDKWNKLNKEFEEALERFDEWTPRKRTPIEATKFDAKIHALAIEYCNNVTLPSMDKDLKLMCQRDFCAGFYKHHELQLQNEDFSFTKEQLIRNKSLQLIDKFISETPKEELDALIKKYHHSDKETETTDTETPIAKLRNQLSPYYSLPDMILNMDVKPEMKALLIEQAKVAKSTNDRIKELLVEIEQWKGYTKEEKEFEDKREILDKFLDPENTNIDIAIRTSIIMHDYDNWDNGDYKGKMGKVVPHVLELIEQHVIQFAEYLHKYYPNVMKPENYREVPIPRGERKWMRAFFDDDTDDKTAKQIYSEFLNHVKNKKI